MEGSYKTEMNKTLPADWQHNKDLGDCMIGLYENNLMTDVKFKCSNHDDHERIKAHKIVLAARSPVFRAQFFGTLKEANDEIVLNNTEAETFDLFLRCSNHDDHERIKAHKIVLAARSPVFQAMFSGTCAQSNEDSVLDNTEAETFDLFLRFIYQDKVTLTEHIASSVLEIAHFYQVTNLVQYCADFLASCITSHNVCEILNLANFYVVTSLCKACCIYIDENAEEVIESEGFLKLSEDNLTYILKGDTFFANEVAIFKKAEEWAQKKIKESNNEQNGQKIRKVLGDSFFHLRLPTMTSDNLLKCTRRKGYFSIEEYEDLVDYINKRPCSTVTSNSCRRRLPSEELMVCNDVRGRYVTIDKIETGFQLYVSRDVKVTAVQLAEMHVHWKVIEKTKTRIAAPELENGLDVVLSGKLKVTCYENKNKVITGTNNEKAESGSLISLPCEIEHENSETLVYEQDVKFKHKRTTRHFIYLTKPLMLEESRSPYIFNVNIEFKDTTSVTMKTIEKSAKTYTSDYDVIKVENLIGKFTGIRGITFENVSNRN